MQFLMSVKRLVFFGVISIYCDLPFSFFAAKCFSSPSTVSGVETPLVLIWVGGLGFYLKFSNLATASQNCQCLDFHHSIILPLPCYIGLCLFGQMADINLQSQNKIHVL